jgi:carbamoyltransferase
MPSNISMRILLIHPTQSSSEMSNAEDLFPSIGLGCIVAAISRSDEVEARSLDAYTAALMRRSLEHLPFAGLAVHLMREFSPQLVGLSTTSHTRCQCLDIARMIKSVSPNTIVVFGGAFASFEYRQLLDRHSSVVDYIVQGEGERAFPQLIQCVSRGDKPKNIEGLYWSEAGKVCGTPSRTPIGLSNCLYPDYLYAASLSENNRIRTIGMVTSRGCPFDCTFCGSRAFWGNQVRAASVERVVAEIEHNLSVYGAETIKFHDDTFTYCPHRALQILQQLRRRRIRPHLYMHTRIDTTTPELLREFRGAGGVGVFFGIESGSMRIRQEMGKVCASTESIISACRQVKDVGLSLGVFVLLGYPGETVRDVCDTFDLLEKLEPDDVYVSTVKIQPGTPLTEWAKAHGMFQDSFWFDQDKEYFTFVDHIPEHKAFVDGCILLLDERYRRTALRANFENNQEANELRRSGVDCDALKSRALDMLRSPADFRAPSLLTHMATTLDDVTGAAHGVKVSDLLTKQSEITVKNTKTDQDIWILGINSVYHESSACLVHNGRIIAAAEEERFNRVRHGKEADLKNPHWLPEQSIRYCLVEAGIGPEAITHIGYSFAPELRLAANIGVDDKTTPGGAGTPQGEECFCRLLKQVPQRLSLLLGNDVRDRFRWIEHHLCHAASAYFVSPFDDAAVFSVDGIGEKTTTWMGHGQGNRLRKLRETSYPSSLGFLWTKMSRFLGFGNYGQWKVMALAAYGDPKHFYHAFRTFVSYGDAGEFQIDGDVLEYRVESCAALERLFGSQRAEHDLIDDRHYDIAAALQRVNNEALLAAARALRAETGSRDLCLAGGVALNCIANRILIEEAGFDDVFVQPAANDAGTALGACYYIWNEVLGKPRAEVMRHAYLGPAFGKESQCLVSQINAEAVRKPNNLAADVARLIAQGKTVALYQGKMEFGPRALGNRSILADPRRADMVQQLNDKVKQRESFRPFAASVLAEHAQKWFVIKRSTAADKFMVLAYPVREEKMGLIAAVTHVDGTTRIQTVDAETNPLFYAVIKEFERLTGVPLVLNTSLNESEPIVCMPIDALRTCLIAGVDYLALEGHLIDVSQCDETVADLLDVTIERRIADASSFLIDADSPPIMRLMPAVSLIGAEAVLSQDAHTLFRCR